jgi:hypothetical protein
MRWLFRAFARAPLCRIHLTAPLLPRELCLDMLESNVGADVFSLKLAALPPLQSLILFSIKNPLPAMFPLIPAC